MYFPFSIISSTQHAILICPQMCGSAWVGAVGIFSIETKVSFICPPSQSLCVVECFGWSFPFAPPEGGALTSPINEAKRDERYLNNI